MCADFETWTSAITNYALMLDLFDFFCGQIASQVSKFRCGNLNHFMSLYVVYLLVV